MNPADFPEANVSFGTPADMTKEQVAPIRGFVGQFTGGCVDGAPIFVSCWQPTPAEIEEIKTGKPIFISFMHLGGLPPHYPSLSFEEATHPA